MVHLSVNHVKQAILTESSYQYSLCVQSWVTVFTYFHTYDAVRQEMITSLKCTKIKVGLSYECLGIFTGTTHHIYVYKFPQEK